jgi:general secretion pathway protein G
MKTPRASRQAGFSLIELIVVMVIVAILAGVVAPRIMGRGDDARLTRTLSDIQTIRKAAELMYADVERFPADGQSDQDPGFADVSKVPTAVRDR